MIPQRVQLKGFLCYKDEQEISFDSHSSLWMLSGMNGSGKSSIFDAVTYALFGEHRGGKHHAVELINKDSDGMTVEFDFRLDGHNYRIRRTLRRKAHGAPASTQQIYRYESANGESKWVAVEGANYKKEFDNWIGDKIGLTYETFTSSVLLLQGHADKLLDSKPDGRRAVLASIVDLKRYERLHEKADDQRKALKSKLDHLSDRLAMLPEVKPEQVTAAEVAIAAAEQAREQARGEWERLRETERRAREWVELQGKLTAARQRWRQATQLLENAAAIARDVERLRELREVLPRMHDIVRWRGEIHTAEMKTKSLQQEKQKAADLLAQRESALHQARDKRTALQTLIAAEESQQRDATAQLLVLTEQMTNLRAYERQEAEAARIQADLSALPSDLSARVTAAREKWSALTVLSGTVPLLADFRTRREELRQAIDRDRTESQRLEQVESKGKTLAAEVKRREPLVEQADRATRQASEQATQARTLHKQAEESLREITQLDGAKTCRHCGQPLTPGHLQDEKRRRSAEVQRTKERMDNDNAVLDAARKAEKQEREQFAHAQKVCQEAREEYSEARNQQQQARAEVARLQAECARVWKELPEPQRRLIATSASVDWLTTRYPTSEELQSLRGEIAELSVVQRQLKAAEDMEKKWKDLKAAESAALTTLQRLQAELPADREGVRRRHTDLTLSKNALEKSLESKRRDWKDSEADSERLARERDRTQTQLNDLDHRLKEQELTRQNNRRSIGSNVKMLPAAWQALAESAGLAELHGWDKERADLETADTEGRGKQLQQAKDRIDGLREDMQALEAQQDDFPEEARRDAAAIKLDLERAKQTESQREKDLSQARRELDRLTHQREQREQIGAEFVRLEGEWKQQETLAKLLGKDRLQLYLVRQAEKQVVEHANAVLDRLSGGQLYLKLSGEAEGEGASGKALDLESYNRVTGEKPFNVAFLSGSQKFRIAVSLALGIGQYASRQHRPIESVIIDEGFGCLDSQGRQVMIQELQNLRSQMRCILLVSHQEEFADAFSDGYQFELKDGATQVSRLRR